MQNKLLMKLLVGSESLFFLSLIVAYLFFRQKSGFNMEARQMLDIKATGFFTAMLISSSFTFWMAERSFKKGNQKKLKLWLIVTIALGIIFLGGQGHEYYDLISKHLTISSSELGTSFFTLTGFHGLHVFIGLIILSVMLILAMAGDFKDQSTHTLSTVGIYWHFVDAVWIIVFSVIYILPHIT